MASKEHREKNKKEFGRVVLLLMKTEKQPLEWFFKEDWVRALGKAACQPGQQERVLLRSPQRGFFPNQVAVR